MEQLFGGVASLLLSNEGKLVDGTHYPLALFALSSATMGFLVVLLDWLMHLSGRDSVLKLIYRGPNIVWLILLWGLGAGLGGFVGAAFGILQLNRAACITIGISWPLILPRIISSLDQHEEREEIESFPGDTE
ncbi:hypothetical protein ACJJIC_16910 [Microbulbifer sp. ANSA002]|uniref:Uncharacterized protein n=1 Tax=Microbulbifer variabilis TaxID=266805 RepID=A0ABY4VE54_9GAMM|nr:hypothetical protein [Microbulbifer variabilis]USD20199.1 hypothetical protein MJO52_14050 [Microbulbifer variabilis]